MVCTLGLVELPALQLLFLNRLNFLILLYIFTTVYIFVGYFINIFLDSVHLFSVTSSILCARLPCMYLCKPESPDCSFLYIIFTFSHELGVYVPSPHFPFLGSLVLLVIRLTAGQWELGLWIAENTVISNMLC